MKSKERNFELKKLKANLEKIMDMAKVMENDELRYLNKCLQDEIESQKSQKELNRLADELFKISEDEENKIIWK